MGTSMASPSRKRMSKRHSAIQLGSPTRRSRETTTHDLTPASAGNPSFIQTVREALENLEEPNKKQSYQETRDSFGAYLSEALNQNPHFHRPLHLGIEDDREEYDKPTLRPLLSSRNGRWMKIVCRDVFFTLKSDFPGSILGLVRFLFRTKKSISGGLLTFCGLGFIFITSACVATTFVALWTLRLTLLVCALGASLLFDLKDLNDLLPTKARQAWERMTSGVFWFDNHVLYGRRYRGREWSKDDFEWRDSKQASSFGSYLWKLPPPRRSKETNEGEREPCSAWSHDTLAHVEAIDYCHVMLREVFLRNQYAKLQSGTFNRKRMMSASDGDQNSDFTQGFNLERSSSEPIIVDDATLGRQLDGLLNSSDDFDDAKAKIPGLDLTTLDTIFSAQDNDSVSSRSTGNGTELTHLSTDSAAGTDLNWMDVGANIGMKLLSSAAIQKAMTSHDTAEKITIMQKKFEEQMRKPRSAPEFRKEKVDPGTGKIQAPVHSMWTSASAAAQMAAELSPAGSVNSNVSEDFIVSRNVQVVENIELEDMDAKTKPLVHNPRTPSCELKASTVVKPSPELSLCNDVVPSPQNDARGGQQAVLQSIESVQKLKPLEVTSKALQKPSRRPLLLPGVKIVVSLFPNQPGPRFTKGIHEGQFQMATVVSSKRLAIFQKNELPPAGRRGTNCLSIKVQLDKSFMRHGKFAEMTFRIMDEWPDRYVPKHSKFPIGSCVATLFGIGILVGWRVEDDCHVVRSLWQRRGPGSACAYLQRDAILNIVNAAVGFEVETNLGKGEVVGYTNAGKEFRSGRYIVELENQGKHHSKTLEMFKTDIIACKSARFIPVIEHIREAVQYQLQLDTYHCTLEQDENDAFYPKKGQQWELISKCSEILWKSFLRATEEDDEFDAGMNEVVTSVMNFFEGLDGPATALDSKGDDISNIIISTTESSKTSKEDSISEPGFWVLGDFFGLFNGTSEEKLEDPDESVEIEVHVNDKLSEDARQTARDKNYVRAFGTIRMLMRTVSIARASCVDEPEFKLALSLCYELLLFAKTLIKVQRKNMSPISLQIWQRAMDEILSTFGPAKERLQKIGKGIAERIEKQGRRAKVRIIRFVDTIVQDEILLMAVENGEWGKCGEQLELALMKSRILDENNREHYQRTAQFFCGHFATILAKSSEGQAKNNELLERFGMMVQCLAAPRKSILRLLVQDWVLDILERVLVRVFDKEDVASQMLSIHAGNFHSLRQFRMLKDFTVAGKFWMPLLDAADAEFSLLVSKMPKNAQEYLLPISKLFSLCILQFRKIDAGDLTTDWLDFLLEDEAVKIIHGMDMKLILALESFAQDVKKMMVVLPYYPSIEDDILNLVDEVDLDEFLKEASKAVEDPEKLSEFIREKSTVAVERFLDYLPKMSIPVEKRDLADGWVLTCRGADGGDLTLTDLSIKRENLTCQVLGGDTIFFPTLGTDDEGDDDHASEASTCNVATSVQAAEPLENEMSVLDHIRSLLLNARRYGCWQEGEGGVNQPPADRYVASVLGGLPVSSVLNCGIELWRNLEIDDDELLEIAIRDVSYQIQLQQQREEAGNGKECKEDPQLDVTCHQALLPEAEPSKRGYVQHRFNPRVDSSILYLEIRNLTFHLENFLFRIEKHESRRTVFDPVFEGSGSLMVRNVSIQLRVECVKDYAQHLGRRRAVPMLQIRELDVQLEKVRLKVKDTGADWLLNKVVKSFEDNITQILATNLNEQVRTQMDLALENLNGYFKVNPDLVLSLLDITMDDLEEKEAMV